MSITLEIKRDGGKIFCPLTNSWHVETPEEKVRQEYIKRLVEDNKALREDKKQLYKLALKTEDSVALINNVHKATYFIAKVIENNGTDEKAKLEVLETYLSEMLREDPTSILDSIEILRDGASQDTLNILDKFENYIRTSF